MSSECRRWIELSDLEAAGQVLSDEARAFQAAHVAGCAECGREAAIWRGTRPVSEAPPEADELEAVLRGVAERGQRERFRSRRRLTAIAAAASVLACAAAVVLWLQAVPKPTPVVKVDGPARVAAPDALASGASCTQPVAGVTVCLAANTQITGRVLDVADLAVARWFRSFPNRRVRVSVSAPRRARSPLSARFFRSKSEPTVFR